MNYQEFIQSKKIILSNDGIGIDENNINKKLFPFQRDIVKWACKKGRCAIFLDTGLGKTFVQLEFARLLNKKTIIIAPLSVARQTIREAKKINIEVKYIRNQNEINDHQIYIINYEMIDHFDFTVFEVIVLDESSIIKSISGSIKKKLFEISKTIPYRMACTATPAPNDIVEIGNHAEFLGICSREEMLAMFFVHANLQEEKLIGDMIVRRKMGNKHGQEWRLKNHARQDFYKWLSTWAISMKMPSDLGYDDTGYILPQLNIEPFFVNVEYIPHSELFFNKLKGITDRLEVRKQFIENKLSLLKEILEKDSGQWIIWTNLQKESDEIMKVLKNENVIEIKGNDSPEYKAEMIESFQDNKYRILVTKPKIAGFGMNFQNAHNMIFFGLNDSWESYYQAMRREWRFGQKHPVNVFVILTDIEQQIWQNIQRKDTNAKILTNELIEAVKTYEQGELRMETINETIEFKSREVIGDEYRLINGDSCQELTKIESDSIHFSVYSPPFADLYTYSNSSFDLGNSKNRDEFFTHYSFIIKEMLRITMTGRINCVHVSDIPALQLKDDYIGIKDFPGEVIKAHEKEGWVLHGRAFIQKNPQAQAIRTHSKALLFAQLRKDSCDSRPALVDQILIFKKPGDNEIPVNPVVNKEIDNETWILWAHGLWTGIRESDVLRYTAARDADDEKHICPLQLATIERCIKLYSNPGEVILTPFGGIGSEPYVALKLKRKAIAIELKESYFDVMVKNIDKIDIGKNQKDLFSEMKNVA